MIKRKRDKRGIEQSPSKRLRANERNKGGENAQKSLLFSVESAPKKNKQGKRPTLFMQSKDRMRVGDIGVVVDQQGLRDSRRNGRMFGKKTETTGDHNNKKRRTLGKKKKKKKKKKQKKKKEKKNKKQRTHQKKKKKKKKTQRKKKEKKKKHTNKKKKQKKKKKEKKPTKKKESNSKYSKGLMKKTQWTPDWGRKN